jgi:hypothetical protein
MNRPGSADDRDDSSKTTPATDMQADDALGPGLGEDLGADGTPAGRGQAREAPRQRPAQDRAGRDDPPRSEQGPTEARARTAMKQEGRTGEDR